MPLSNAMKECAKIHEEFWNMGDTEPFREPVDWKAWELFDYPNIIKHPMDLGTVKKKLEKEKYTTPQEFAKDMRLIWQNCKIYNADGSDFYVLADKLSKLFDKKMKAVAPELSGENDEDSAEPSVEEKTQFSQNIYKISSEDLGHVVQLLDKQCATSLEKTSEDEIEINIDAIDAKTFKVVDDYVKSKLSATKADQSLSKSAKKAKKKKVEDGTKTKRQKT